MENRRARLTAALAGLAFPARRWQLIAQAKDYGADAQTQLELQSLPEQMFGHLADVVRAVEARDAAAGQGTVGVEDEEEVAVVEQGEEEGEGLVERTCLAVGVGHGLEHLGAERRGHGRGVVGAAVGDHHDTVGWEGLPPQRGQRRGERGLLVVRGDQRDDPCPVHREQSW